MNYINPCPERLILKGEGWRRRKGKQTAEGGRVEEENGRTKV